MEGVREGVAWMGDCGILAAMTPATDSPSPQPGPAAQDALGRGVYDVVEAVRVVRRFHQSFLNKVF